MDARRRRSSRAFFFSGCGGVERAASATSSFFFDAVRRRRTRARSLRSRARVSSSHVTGFVVSFRETVPGSDRRRRSSSRRRPRLASPPRRTRPAGSAAPTAARARAYSSKLGVRERVRGRRHHGGRGHHEALEKRWPRVTREVEIALALVEAVGFCGGPAPRTSGVSGFASAPNRFSGFFVVIRVGALFARARRVLPGRGVLRASSSGKKAGGRRDARGGSGGWPSVVYSSTRRSTTRPSKLFFKTWRALAAIVGGGFVSGLRESRAESRFASFRPEPFAAAKARRSARDRASRDVEADGATRARRLVRVVSYRCALRGRDASRPVGWMPRRARGPSRVLGRSGSITRTDARRGRRRGGTRRAR